MNIDRLKKIVKQDWRGAKTLHLRIWRCRDVFLLKWLIYCRITVPITVTGLSFWFLHSIIPDGFPPLGAVNVLVLSIFLLRFPLILGILLCYFLNIFGFVKEIMSDPWFRRGPDSNVEYRVEKFNQVMDSSYKWFVRSTLFYAISWFSFIAIDIFLGVSLDPATDMYLHLERSALFFVNHSPFAPVTEVGPYMNTLDKTSRFMLFFTSIVPAFMYTISYRRYIFVANQQGIPKNRFWRSVWSISGTLSIIILTSVLSSQSGF